MAAVNTTSLIRISISSAGVPGNSGSIANDISDDGRYVLFYSPASNLAGNDANSTNDLFLRDTVTGTTTVITVSPQGATGNNVSYGGSVSDDGRYVAFSSSATNLVADDTNNTDDVFVRDLQSGATFRISQAADGTGGNDYSSGPAITGDGRTVYFDSSASNLVAGDGNDSSDIFVYDMLSGTNRLVSVATDGSQGNGSSFSADASADGRYVVFSSRASNLIAGDTNGVQDIFLRDLQAGTTTRVSLGANGAQATDFSYNAQVSDNGRYVVFQSDATNLVAGDTNGQQDIYLRDTVSGTTKLVSANTGGVVGSSGSYNADLSADGRYVVFESSATNLVAGDTNNIADIFLRDTVAGTTTRLSLAWNGAEANDFSGNAHISADGRYVTFYSAATNLIRGDSSNGTDVFRVSLVASDAADRMIGSDGADTINGLGGADILDGGLGADTLTGGTDNDTFIVDNAGDRVVEAAGGGTDSVLARVSYTLAAGQAIESLAAADRAGLDTLNLTGNAFANTLTGNDGANILNGAAGADTLIGGGGGDSFYVDTASDRIIEAAGGGYDTVYASASYTLNTGQEIEQLRTSRDAGTAALKLTGNAFANKIVGNAGANTLNGGLGSDTLYGKAGKDTFVFANTPSASNRDHLGDFSAADDTIQLSKAIFTALSAGTLAASAFKDLSVSGATVDASDRILYNKTTGVLSYDADGSGTKAAVQFAIVDTKVALTNADFFVV